MDSPSDEMPRIVAEELPTVHLTHREQQTDPGTTRNLGVVQARGEIIACIDTDCIAPSHWLKRMVAAQRAGQEVVGGRIENGNPESLVAWARYLGEFRKWLPVGRARLANHIPKCSISYHGWIFARSGGFPTRFYTQEDLLYHWQLLRHRVPIWFHPRIRVQHVHSSTWRACTQHLRNIGRITARVLKLTGEEGVFLARSPVLTLLAALVLPLAKWLRTTRPASQKFSGYMLRPPRRPMLDSSFSGTKQSVYASNEGDPGSSRYHFDRFLLHLWLECRGAKLLAGAFP